MINKTKGSYPNNEIGKTSKDQRIVRPVDLNKVIDEINDEFAAVPNTLQEITTVGATTSVPTTFSGGISNQYGVIKPYKSYVAKLTQPGNTDAPTVTVLENTIGNIVWTRTNIGRYQGTLTGAFTASGFWQSMSIGVFQIDAEVVGDLVRQNNNVVEINIYDNTFTNVEGFIADIEIRAYL